MDLGKQTGLSPSMISQLENGKLTPTLPTLTRIAMVFEVGLDFFFAGSARPKPFAVTRAADRAVTPLSIDGVDTTAFMDTLPGLFPEKGHDLFAVKFPPREAHSEPHVHDGIEFIYLFSGNLEIRTSQQVYQLNTGDCCRFDSSEPHSYRCASPEEASAFVIVLPQALE